MIYSSVSIPNRDAKNKRGWLHLESLSSVSIPNRDAKNVYCEYFEEGTAEAFQSLIGTLKTPGVHWRMLWVICVSIPNRDAKNASNKCSTALAKTFQSLIGTLKTWGRFLKLQLLTKVSIPNRDAKNLCSCAISLYCNIVSIPNRDAKNGGDRWS